jgi:hypothetical protein
VEAVEAADEAEMLSELPTRLELWRLLPPEELRLLRLFRWLRLAWPARLARPGKLVFSGTDDVEMSSRRGYSLLSPVIVWRGTKIAGRAAELRSIFRYIV